VTIAVSCFKDIRRGSLEGVQFRKDDLVSWAAVACEAETPVCVVDINDTEMEIDDTAPINIYGLRQQL